jgi:putative redox protein
MKGKMKRIKYANNEITVVWQPGLCCHSGFCFTGLPEVFMPQKRKWIDPYGASNDRIIEQVNECPTGALSWYRNTENQGE